MAEYIEREALLREIERRERLMVGDKTISVDALKRFILNRPAADAAPVVHTRWAHLGGDEWCCPVCGFVLTTEGSWDKPTKKYCEDCGAKMDGGADNDTN